MSFLNKKYIDNICSNSVFKNDYREENRTIEKVANFQQAKNVLLDSHVSKDTWYLIMNHLTKELEKNYLGTTKIIDIISYLSFELRENGVCIPIDDLRNILYAYEDILKIKNRLATSLHYSLWGLAAAYYRYNKEAIEIEHICLTHLLVIKALPNEIYSAEFPIVKIASNYLLNLNRIDDCIAYCEMITKLMPENSPASLYCQRRLKRLLKSKL